MPALDFQFHAGGIYFPQLRFWLDARRRQEELVFVSHAHSDHVANHREVILSEPTARLMTARLGGRRIEHVLPYGEARTLRRGGDEFRLTLLPAGHILGSAMALIECAGESLLYTGDFKLRRGLSAEPCKPCRADVLIMETTFGRPEYRFPSPDKVIREVIHFCRRALDEDGTAILHCYSLGKSQELLCHLAYEGLPIVLHTAVHKMTQVYEQFGHRFPPYDEYEAGAERGNVVVCPHGNLRAPSLRSPGPTCRAVLTGWAIDSSCRFRYQCDAAFPLSDHADYDELIEFVRQVQPRRVYTLHGFAADFAATLRELGFDARALGEEEQLSLGLEMAIPSLSDHDREPS